MPINEILVDDILGDIKRKSNEVYNQPLSTMEHVDDIIKEILEQRQNAELQKEKRTLSLREKMELEEEIKIQTKTLTAQFEKLKKTGDKRLIEVKEDVENADTKEHIVEPIPDETPLHLSPTQELNILRSEKSKENQVSQQEKLDKFENEIEIDAIKASVEQTSSVLQETPTPINIATYKELKNNRNRVIDAFVLDPKKPKQSNTKEDNEKIAEDILQTPIKKSPRQKATDLKAEPQDDFATNDGEYEYLQKSQREEVLANLKGTAKKTTISVILFAILSVFAFALLFSRQSASAESILLVGVFPVSATIYAMVNIATVIVALICSVSIFANAFSSLAQHKPDKDILYLIAMLSTLCGTVIIGLKPQVLLNSSITFYVPILIFLLLLNFIAKKRTIARMIESFDRISNDEPLYAATAVSDRKAVDSLMSGVDTMGETMLLCNVKTDFTQNFLAHSLNSDKSDDLAQKMSAIVFPLMLIIFAVAYIWSKNLFLALSLGCSVPLLLIGFITPILVAFPLSDSADLIKHFAGVMPDYDAIDCFCETDAVMLDATDLFDETTILLHGIKTFQGKRIDTAIVEAASIVTTANSVLKSVFMSIIANDTSLLKPVDSIVYEDSMGISGWVNEKRVLIGNRALMINHSIAVPKEEYELKYQEQGQELIYLSSEGELCAAFVLEFTRSNDAADLIDLLMKNDVSMIIKSVDSCITTELIEKVFALPVGKVKILPSHLHRTYEEQIKPLAVTDGAMANNGGAFSMVVLVAACKKLLSCINLGVIMQYVSAGFCILLLLASLFLHLPVLSGALQLTLFMALFGIVYWLFEKNVKL